MCRFKAMDKDPEDGGKKDVQTRLFLKENRRDKVSTAPKRCVYGVEAIRLQHQGDAFTALRRYKTFIDVVLLLPFCCFLFHW